MENLGKVGYNLLKWQEWKFFSQDLSPLEALLVLLRLNQLSLKFIEKLYPIILNKASWGLKSIQSSINGHWIDLLLFQKLTDHLTDLAEIIRADNFSVA